MDSGQSVAKRVALKPIIGVINHAVYTGSPAATGDALIMAGLSGEKRNVRVLSFVIGY